MSRPIVGTDISQSEELPRIEGMEFRDSDGTYWRFHSDGLCHTIQAGGPCWNIGKVLNATTGPVIVTYMPPVPSPHTKPGIYVCSEMLCQYLFERMDQDLWQGPWRPDGTVVRKGPMLTREELEEQYGDCSRNLVGPVPPVFLKGH